jgi:L-cysteate sulfo-lyase
MGPGHSETRFAFKEETAMTLASLPRIGLAHLPTPLEPLSRLSTHLCGPDIFIKRDDCTGLATGGNKTRKLEFLMADALRRGADIVLTTGAVQSNHVRQTAAAAARLGLDCHALLETEVPCEEASYQASGNVLLDGLFGATLEYFEHGTNMDAALRAHARTLTADGRKPYVIPVGGSNAIGALGYVGCAEELCLQARGERIPVTRIVHATGSGGTQAGLLAGFCALGADVDVTGISVSDGKRMQTRKVGLILEETAELIGLETNGLKDGIVVNARYIGDGYGLPTEGMREAVELCARLEGVLLDPVYSGKAMAGLIGMIRSGEITANETVVFLHSGGFPGLFAYDWFFNRD